LKCVTIHVNGHQHPSIVCPSFSTSCSFCLPPFLVRHFPVLHFQPSFLCCQIIIIFFLWCRKHFAQSLNFPMKCHSSECILLCLKVNLTFCTADRSDNFTVGLTNVSPLITAPTLWNYTVCGQYPGAVGAGATVALKCACGLPAYRYVIVQFPTTGYANFMEVEVYVSRKFFYTKFSCNYVMFADLTELHTESERTKTKPTPGPCQ